LFCCTYDCCSAHPCVKVHADLAGIRSVQWPQSCSAKCLRYIPAGSVSTMLCRRRHPQGGSRYGVSLANEHRRLPRTPARSTHLATVGARAKERLERLPRGRDGAKPLRGIPQRPHSAPRMSARLLVGGPFPHAMHLAEADGVEGLCALGVVASLARRLAVQLVRVANSALDRELAGIPSDLGRPFARQRNIQ